MYYDPKKMAEDVGRFVAALRTAPIRRREEDAEEFAARVLRWTENHAEAIEQADNTPWVDEIKNLLSDHKNYSDRR